MERFFRILLPKPPLPETSSPPALRFNFPCFVLHPPMLGTSPSQRGSVVLPAWERYLPSMGASAKTPVLIFMYLKVERGVPL